MGRSPPLKRVRGFVKWRSYAKKLQPTLSPWFPPSIEVTAGQDGRRALRGALFSCSWAMSAPWKIGASRHTVSLITAQEFDLVLWLDIGLPYRRIAAREYAVLPQLTAFNRTQSP